MKKLFVLLMILVVTLLFTGCQMAQIKSGACPLKDVVIIMDNGELFLLKKQDLSEENKGRYWMPLDEFEKKVKELKHKRPGV